MSASTRFANLLAVASLVALAAGQSCTGSSASLLPEECAGWQAVVDALDQNGGLKSDVAKFRSTPCECNSGCPDPQPGDPCVECKDGHITFLDLKNQMRDGKFGAMPGAAIGSFSRLEHLDIRDNNLRGTIPSEIGQLVSLTLSCAGTASHRPSWRLG